MSISLISMEIENQSINQSIQKKKSKKTQISISHLKPYLSSCALLASMLRMLLSAKGQPERLKNTAAEYQITLNEQLWLKDTAATLKNTCMSKISTRKCKEAMMQVQKVD